VVNRPEEAKTNISENRLIINASVPGRKDIRPVKNRVVGCWRGCLSETRCRLAYAQLMPLPLTVSCFSKIQIGFTFLVPAQPGSPRKRAVKLVCVCVSVLGLIICKA